MKANLISLVLLSGWIGILPNGLAYQIVLSPASRLYDPDPNVMDKRLGFSGGNLVREGFEEQQLIPEIKSNLTGRWQEGDTANGPSSWDGQWASSPSDKDATFSILVPGIRRFGIGIGDNDFGGNEELTINDGDPISLNELSGHDSNGQGRSFYLEIQAEPNEPDIRSVRIAKGYTLRFDHLILQRGGEKSLSGLDRPPETAANPRQQLVEAGKSSGRGLAESNQAGPRLSELRNRGTLLLSKAGKKYVGDQLRLFFVDQGGVITTAKPEWINLYYTEGKPYRLQGKVSLGGSSSEMLFSGDLPDGFALFVREWDGLQRYSFTSRGVDVKRRLYRGERTSAIITIQRFEEPMKNRWIPFSMDVNWNRIVFSFGKQTVVVDGPLDTDGANKIAIAPGTQLKDLRLDVFDIP